MKWLYALKVIRIIDGFKLMDVNNFMKNIRQLFNWYTNWKIDHDRDLADDTIRD